MAHSSLPRSPDLIDRVVMPLRDFGHNKLAGAVLLLAATGTAMVWANTAWGEYFTAFYEYGFTVGFDNAALSKPSIHWINDGVMGLFFFVVGLEIKREVLEGELAAPGKAFLPVVAACGGMVVPSLLYLLLNAGGPGAHGWGIPMATDIAFALGVLALLGDRVPIGLKVFLTALAIVDDIGAIVVIAIFYTENIAFSSLVFGVLLFLISAGANRLGVRSRAFYAIMGFAVWLLFLKSGVHATLAAVLMAFTIPARTRLDDESFAVKLETLLQAFKAQGLEPGLKLLRPGQQAVLSELATTLDEGTAPLQRLEHLLAPIVTFVVLPLFALANAGVTINAGLLEAFADPVCQGVVLGLFIGKPLGIVGFSWLVVRARLAALPEGVTWSQISAAGILAGIGFTMALFIGGLAFVRPEFIAHAKIGILTASAVAGVLGAILLHRALRRLPEETPPPPEPWDTPA